MQEHITSLIAEALADFVSSYENFGPQPQIELGRTKDPEHGEFSTNIALKLAGRLKSSPREIADSLIAKLPESKSIKKVEVAGPGFINFFLNPESQNQIIKSILEKNSRFGLQGSNGKKICLEFVSANPTGPLHVGHGRGAAYGASLANILQAAGFKVTTEYYVNDAGRQMDILTVSVWLRYLDLSGIEVRFPDNGYQGDYIWDIGARIHRQRKEELKIDSDELLRNIRADEAQGGDKEQHIDDLIAKAKVYLKDNYTYVFKIALETILQNIKQDLKSFRVEYDNWFSEISLNDSNEIDKTIKDLEGKGDIYSKQNAKWFKTTAYGDDKDRVVVRENGLNTYFASDIAYHKNKFDRGFDNLINIWGADHHGYIPRMQASIKAMGFEPKRLTMLLVQFANLYRSGEKIPMSTRSGSFVTLRELYTEVGVDAARYFYIMRKSEQHLDFDLDLAKSKSNENPVYYIQYAHARTQSVMHKLKQHGFSWDVDQGLDNLELLTTDKEQALIKRLNQYQDILLKSADNFAPHYLAFYLKDLANEYHTYYNAYKFILDDEDLRNARLCLINAVRIIIHNGLGLIGVLAPDKM